MLLQYTIAECCCSELQIVEAHVATFEEVWSSALQSAVALCCCRVLLQFAVAVCCCSVSQCVEAQLATFEEVWRCVLQSVVAVCCII